MDAEQSIAALDAARFRGHKPLGKDAADGLLNEISDVAAAVVATVPGGRDRGIFGTCGTP